MSIIDFCSICFPKKKSVKKGEKKHNGAYIVRSRLFFPPSHLWFVLCIFIARRLQLFLLSSTRVELCLPTLGALSSWSFLIFANKFRISPRRDSNSQTNTGTQHSRVTTRPPGRPATLGLYTSCGRYKVYPMGYGPQDQQKDVAICGWFLLESPGIMIPTC